MGSSGAVVVTRSLWLMYALRGGLGFGYVVRGGSITGQSAAKGPSRSHLDSVGGGRICEWPVRHLAVDVSRGGTRQRRRSRQYLGGVRRALRTDLRRTSVAATSHHRRRRRVRPVSTYSWTFRACIHDCLRLGHGVAAARQPNFCHVAVVAAAAAVRPSSLGHAAAVEAVVAARLPIFRLHLSRLHPCLS